MLALRVYIYDITSDRRRSRVADALMTRATRVQLSVYEARLTNDKARSLFEEVEAMLAPGDRLRMYTIPDGALPKCHEVGGPPVRDGARYWLL